MTQIVILILTIEAFQDLHSQVVTDVIVGDLITRAVVIKLSPLWERAGREQPRHNQDQVESTTPHSRHLTASMYTSRFSSFFRSRSGILVSQV